MKKLLLLGLPVLISVVTIFNKIKGKNKWER